MLFETDRREQSDGAEFVPSRWVKICPHCLTIWAVSNFDNDINVCYQIHAVSCQNCGVASYNAPVPGSILDNSYRLATDWDLFEDLPEPLLKREAKLHLERLINERTTAINVSGSECPVGRPDGYR